MIHHSIAHFFEGSACFGRPEIYDDLKLRSWATVTNGNWFRVKWGGDNRGTFYPIEMYYVIQDPFPSQSRLSLDIMSPNYWENTPPIPILKLLDPRSEKDSYDMNFIGDEYYKAALSQWDIKDRTYSLPGMEQFSELTILGEKIRVNGGAYILSTRKSVNRGYGINWLPVGTADCDEFKKGLPIYARPSYIRETQTTPKEWLTMDTAYDVNPLHFCTCNHTYTVRGMHCQLQDGTCKDPTQADLIDNYALIGDGVWDAPGSMSKCQACYNCRKHWTLCPIVIISLCQEWLEPDQWNETLQGEPMETGVQRFDEMETFCNSAEPPVPQKKQPTKPTVQTVVKYTLIGLLLFVVILYAILKSLQIKNALDDDMYLEHLNAVNYMVFIFEIIPRQTYNALHSLYWLLAKVYNALRRFPMYIKSYF